MTALAVVPGGVVWITLGVTGLVWVVVSATVPGLPTPAAVARWAVSSWAGRLIVLALWAEAGWHLFAQRP